ncbi:MAG: lysylphosphatidylglycerol synthase transmembrane domain-containing protein [Anaerolineae bacterium]
MSNRKRLFDLLKIALSILLIVFLLQQIGLGNTLAVLSQANVYYLMAALFLFLLGVVLRAYRWQTLLCSLGLKISLSELTALYFVGFLFSNVLPSGFGGDVVKMYELSRSSHRATESVNTVFADRFFGLIVLQAFAFLALPFGYRLVSSGVLLLTLVLFAFSLAVACLLFSRALWRWLDPIMGKFLPEKSKEERTWVGKLAFQMRKLYDSFHNYESRAIFKVLSISFLFNLTLIAVNYFIALALRVDIPIWYFLLFVPLTSVILMIPISLNGLGIREAGYVALFAQAGVPESVAFSMSLLIYAMTVLTGLIGGVIYVLRGTREYISET